MRFSSFTLVLLTGLAGIAAADEKTHCSSKEKIVWDCSGTTKTYSLCASGDLGSSQGYLQYRAGPFGHPDFVYPSARRHPRGHFTYESANRAAYVRFKNQQYSYELRDALLAPSQITVTRGAAQIANIQCRSSTQSLNDNDTIKLFNTAGIAEQ